jgi:hypothetical protein
LTGSRRYSASATITARLFFPQWAARQLSAGQSWERGPERRLSASEIMTIVVLYHGARYRYFKNIYEGVALVC